MAKTHINLGNIDKSSHVEARGGNGIGNITNAIQNNYYLMTPATLIVMVMIYYLLNTHESRNKKEYKTEAVTTSSNQTNNKDLFPDDSGRSKKQYEEEAEAPLKDANIWIYAPLSKNANLNQHRQLCSDLKRTKELIENNHRLRNAGLVFTVTDKYPKKKKNPPGKQVSPASASSSKVCILFCDGIDQGEQELLSMKDMTPNVIIVFMKYGPEHTARYLLNEGGGVQVVLWFRIDALTTISLAKLVQDHIIALLEKLGQAINLKGFVHSLNRNPPLLCTTTIKRNYGILEGLQESSNRTAPLLDWDEQKLTKVQLNIRHQVVLGFDDPRLVDNLKLRASDLIVIKDFIKKKKSEGNSEDIFILDSSLSTGGQGNRSQYCNSRAIALNICVKAAEKSLFPGGVYRVAPSKYQGLAQKNFIEDLFYKIQNDALIWFDAADEIFHGCVDTFYNWKKRVRARATCLFSASDDKVFPTTTQFLDNLRKRKGEHKVQSLIPSIVLDEASPHAASASNFSTYEGVVKLSPVPGNPADQLPDEVVTKVLRRKTHAFTNAHPDDIVVFKDDNSIWIVTVRIRGVKRLKRIFDAIHSCRAEDMLNKALANKYSKLAQQKQKGLKGSQAIIPSDKKNFFRKFSKRKKIKAKETTTKHFDNFFTIDLEDSMTMYEQGILQVHKMTPEQIHVIQEALDHSKIHIIGVAGTGKTFVGLYFLLEFLKVKQESSKKKALFVCPTLPLCLYFAGWLLSRLQVESDEEANAKLTLMVFLVGENEDGYQLEVQGESLEIIECNFNEMDFGIVICDEAHEKFARKRERSYKLWNEGTGLLSKIMCPLSTTLLTRNFKSHQDFEGVEISQSLHKVLTREECRVILLSDLSQASETADQIAFPQGYKKFQLKEVTRCSKTIMIASKTFLPLLAGEEDSDNYRNNDSTCAHDTDGPMVISSLYDVPDGCDDSIELCKDKVREEIKRIRESYKRVELHKRRLAIIVPSEGSLEKYDYFKEPLKELGLRRISAVEALRKCWWWKSGDNNVEEEVLIDTVHQSRGLEFMFVILVDMDRPVTDNKPGMNKETQSWFFSGITRSHCHLSIVNKNIANGFLNWLHSTHAAKIRGDLSLEEEDKKIRSEAVTILTDGKGPADSENVSAAAAFDPPSTTNDAEASVHRQAIKLPNYSGESTIWKNVVKSTEYRLENARFNPLAIDPPHLEDDGDLHDLCTQKDWERVRDYLWMSKDAAEVKQRILLWKDDDDGYNCLHLACGGMYDGGAPIEVILGMIRIGGRRVVMATSKVGWTPLHIFCLLGFVCLEAINALVESGGRELVMIKDGSDSTALHYLCDWGVEPAQALLAKGGRELLRIKNHNGDTALDFARKYKNPPSDFIAYLTNY